MLMEEYLKLLDLPEEVINMPTAALEVIKTALDVINRQKQSEIPIKLTEKEIFALAYVSNVPMQEQRIETQEGKLNVTLHMTTVPCNAVWDGQKFIVGYAKRT